MTLVEIKNQVVEVLIKKQTFDVNDFEKIKVSEDLVKSRDSLIREALKDLVETKFVRAGKADGDIESSVWVMEFPVGFHGQQVEIDLQTASLVASVINRYREANKIEDQYCNVLAINQADIQNLCGIALELLNDREEVQEETE